MGVWLRLVLMLLLVTVASPVRVLAMVRMVVGSTLPHMDPCRRYDVAGQVPVAKRYVGVEVLQALPRSLAKRRGMLVMSVSAMSRFFIGTWVWRISVARMCALPMRIRARGKR